MSACMWANMCLCLQAHTHAQEHVHGHVLARYSVCVPFSSVPPKQGTCRRRHLLPAEHPGQAPGHEPDLAQLWATRHRRCRGRDGRPGQPGDMGLDLAERGADGGRSAGAPPIVVPRSGRGGLLSSVLCPESSVQAIAKLHRRLGHNVRLFTGCVH